MAVREEQVLLQDWKAEHRVKIFSKASARKRHVIYGTFLYAEITSLNPDASMVTVVISDTLRLVGSPGKRQRKEAEKDQWLRWQRIFNWFVCPEIVLRKSLFCGKLEGGEKAAVDKEWEKLEKIPAWDLTKVRSKSQVIDEARTKGAKVHFASLMDICHLKNAELEPQFQKYKGRVVLRGGIVKEDSFSYAVFTEQGSSACQMTAAKIMDIISRLPGCDGQAADAASAHIQVKLEDAPRL